MNQKGKQQNKQETTAKKAKKSYNNHKHTHALTTSTQVTEFLKGFRANANNKTNK